MPITDPVSRTARLTAAARARESRRPDRLFDDPFAEALAGPDGFAFMERMEATMLPAAGGENPYIAIRTRFFDDFLTGGLAAREDLRQVVLVAAGLDTRAYRLDWPPGTRLFELDRPELLDAKEEVLARLGAKPRCARKVIGLDLSRPWGDAARANGVDPASPSAWLVEGLTPYLDGAAVRAVIAQTAALAARGSCLGADVIGASFLTSPWTQPYLQGLARENAPWKFGTDDPEGLFAAAGWTAATTRPGEPGASYGRWPYPVMVRGTPGIPNTFLVTASK